MLHPGRHVWKPHLVRAPAPVTCTGNCVASCPAPLQGHGSGRMTGPTLRHFLKHTHAVSAGAPGTTMQVDDRLYAWEAMSLLLASDDVPQEMQATCVQGLLQQLCTQLRSNLEGDLSSIAVMGSSPPASAAHPSLALTATASHAMLLSQALEAVARLSKGFSQERMTKLRPHIGASPSPCQIFLSATFNVG